jgi:DNA modification methylase
MKTMEDKTIDFVLTSPPYNRKRNDKYELYDDLIVDYYKFNVEVINELLRLTKNYVFYIIQTNFYNKQDVYKLIGKFSKDIKEIIIWEKSNPLPASGKAITNAVEYFIVLGDKPLKSNTTYTKNIIKSSVNSNMPKFHKAVMKQEIADLIIEKFAYNSNNVFDPFMGLGTTGIAAAKNNKDFIGIELIKEYYDYAKDKLNELQ